MFLLCIFSFNKFPLVFFFSNLFFVATLFAFCLLPFGFYFSSFKTPTENEKGCRNVSLDVFTLSLWPSLSSSSYIVLVRCSRYVKIFFTQPSLVSAHTKNPPQRHNETTSSLSCFFSFVLELLSFILLEALVAVAVAFVLVLVLVFLDTTVVLAVVFLVVVFVGACPSLSPIGAPFQSHERKAMIVIFLSNPCTYSSTVCMLGITWYTLYQLPYHKYSKTICICRLNGSQILLQAQIQTLDETHRRFETVIP